MNSRKANILIALRALVLGAALSVARAEPVRVGGPKNISILPLIAEHFGHYDTELKLAPFTPLMTGKITMDSLLSGEIDVGVIVDSNIAFMSFQESDLVVLAAIGVQLQDGLLVTKRDSSDVSLKGLRIGYLPATTSHVFLHRLLKNRKLELSDVELFPLQPPAMGPALAAELVDAVSIWQPWRFNISPSKNGKVEEIRNSSDIYDAHIYLATTKAMLRRPEVLKGLLLGLFAAEQYYENHPESAREFLASELRLSRPQLESMVSSASYKVMLTDRSVEIVQEIADWLFSDKIKTWHSGEPPRVDALFHPEVLRDVAAERSRLVSKPSK
jgi:ABC-type nitrate/sulfonate/bicarbonate transport system substrate-binding protein